MSWSQDSVRGARFHLGALQEANGMSVKCESLVHYARWVTA